MDNVLLIFYFLFTH
uniref:Uncharacterized protein n=1 Tax=Lepeophtheirus salmonis TaxID=72036 RepID=A0A0K2V088_LEPSM